MVKKAAASTRVTSPGRPTTPRGRKAAEVTRTPSYVRRRESLIGLAIDVFSRHGYVGGTTTEIADLAGLTQPALYHYVGGKGAFLEEICERVGSRLRGAMESVLSSNVGPGERLRDFIHAYAEVVLAEQAAFRIYVTEASHLPKAARDKLRAEERWYQDKLTALVQAAIESGELATTVPPLLVGQVLMGALSWAYRWRRGEVTATDIADGVVELISLTPRSSGKV